MTWTAPTYAFGSKLTSTKMTQNQDNFTALARGDSGAPSLGLYLPIADQDASSSAQIDFTGFGTYSAIIIQYTDVVPATDGSNFYFRVGTGAGPTYATTNYYKVNGGGNQGQFILNDETAGNEVGGAANQSISGEVIIWSPKGSKYKSLWSRCSYIRSSDDIPFEYSHGGMYLDTTVLTGLRFLFSSGNIASGHFVFLGYGNDYV